MVAASQAHSADVSAVFLRSNFATVSANGTAAETSGVGPWRWMSSSPHHRLNAHVVSAPSRAFDSKQLCSDLMGERHRSKLV